MGLFNGDVLKKVQETAERFEVKRKELQEKRTSLVEERNFLKSEIENDFQRQVMEDSKPNGKLQSDYDKVVSDLEQVNIKLGSIDDLKQRELNKYVEKVEKERQAFIKDADKDLDEVKDEMLEIKLKYLQALVKHQEKKHELNKEFGRKFNDLNEFMDVKGVDFRSRSELPQNFGVDYHDLSPMINNAELKEGLQRNLTYNVKQAIKNK